MKKFERQSDRSGFTLIEMLIVITIVGLLSMMAVGSYTHYRKSSLVDLAADNIVSTLYKARDEVRFGKDLAGLEDQAVCRGVKLVVEEGVKEISSVFSGQKVWNGSSESWSKGSCSGNYVDSLIDMDDLVVVSEVENSDMGECVFLYEPPNGEVSGLSSCGQVILKYGEASEGQFERMLDFNSSNGIVNITNPNSGDEEEGEGI